MKEREGIPDYAAAMGDLVCFVKRIAQDESQSEAIKEEAKEVLGEFLLAGLFKLAAHGAKRDLDELEAENPDGFRNPPDIRGPQSDR